MKYIVYMYIHGIFPSVGVCIRRGVYIGEYGNIVFKYLRHQLTKFDTEKSYSIPNNVSVNQMW